MLEAVWTGFAGTVEGGRQSRKIVRSILRHYLQAWTLIALLHTPLASARCFGRDLLASNDSHYISRKG